MAGTGRASGVVVAAFTLALAAGCRQVAGLDDSPTLETCADFSYPSGTCGPCLDSHCCDQVAACQADPACAKWQACVAGCSDDACVESCDDEGPFGESAARLRSCKASHCEAACGLICGGGEPGCGACADGCCAAERACQQSLDCNRLRVCTAACPAADAGCREACRNLHAEGASLRAAVDACVALRCDLEPDLSCVGAVAWPQADVSQLDVTFQVRDVGDASVVPGVMLDVCRHADPACSPPVASGVTAASGSVQLGVGLTGSYYEGFVALAGADRYPSLFYFYPPLASGGTAVAVSIGEASFHGIAAAADVTLDPARGHVVVELLDCGLSPAAGMRLTSGSVDAETQAVYIDGTLIAAGADRTTPSGRAGLLGLPPGIARLAVEQADSCAAVAEVDVLVKPGTLTMLRLPPTP